MQIKQKLFYAMRSTGAVAFVAVGALSLPIATRSHAETAKQALATAYQTQYREIKKLGPNATPAQKKAASDKAFARANELISQDLIKKRTDFARTLAGASTAISAKAKQTLKERHELRDKVKNSGDPNWKENWKKAWREKRRKEREAKLAGKGGAAGAAKGTGKNTGTSGGLGGKSGGVGGGSATGRNAQTSTGESKGASGAKEIQFGGQTAPAKATVPATPPSDRTAPRVDEGIIQER